MCVCFVSFISYFLLDSSNIPLSHVYCSHALLFYKMMRFFLLLLLTLFPPSFVCLCVSLSVVHSFIHSLQRLSSILHWFWRTILVLLWPFIEIFIGFSLLFFGTKNTSAKSSKHRREGGVKKKTLNSLYEYVWRNGNCSRQCLQWTSPAGDRQCTPCIMLLVVSGSFVVRRNMSKSRDLYTQFGCWIELWATKPEDLYCD